MNRLPPKDQMIMGVHALEEVLQFAPEKILKVYTTSSKKSSSLLKKIEEKRIPVHFVDKDLLEKMSGSESHQMFVAHIRGRVFLHPKEFLKREKTTSFVLMLDQIFDPQNFGALIRSAECFGIDAVIFSKNRGCDITPMVTKASSGASELIELMRVSNLSQTVDLFQEEGFEVVASVLGQEAESAYSFSFAPKTLLIVGSEGEGIQPLLQKKADRMIYLPMEGKVASLNVAQATTAFFALYQLQKKKD